MSNMEITNKPKSRARLLERLLEVAGSPAMANLVPAGPGSLATGQVGGAARGGRLSREIARCRAADGGRRSGYEAASLGCSNA